MAPIRVLALAPEVAGLPRLAAPEEMARIGDAPGVTVRSLLDVTRQRIIDRLSREEFDALVVIGHGGPGYVLLSAGERLDPQWLADKLVNFGVRLAVIATCFSSQRPEAEFATLGFSDVLPAAGIDTITMDAQVADRAAVEYDVALLQSLATGSTLRRAHDAGVAAAAAFGGVQQPRLTPRDGETERAGTKRMANGDVTDYRLTTTEQLLKRMDGKMDQLVEKQREMELEQRWQKEQISGLRNDMAELQTTVTTLQTAVATMRSTGPEVRREWLIGTAGLLFLMLVVLLVLTLRVL